MKSCRYCKATVLFGGYRDGDRRYCNESCYAEATALSSFDAVPDDLVVAHARELRAGDCPRCNARGPVEVHTSYRVVSALLVTSWKNTPHVACRGCARVKQAQDLIISLFLGWWGIPWGLLMTPVQLLRGIAAVTKGDVERGGEPSAALLAAVRYQIVTGRIESAEVPALDRAA